MAAARAAAEDALKADEPRVRAKAKEFLEQLDRALPAPTDEAREKALADAKAVTDEEREKVRAAGGLLVIGTERHESRRIDNQLRGRSGRQGDPGES